MLIQWVLTIIVGALGALLGVYYREAIVIARKARFYVNRLDVILADFEYDALHGDLKPMFKSA